MFDHCWRQQHHLRSVVVLYNSGSLRLYTGCKAPQLCRTQARAPLWRHHCFCLRKVCILLWKDFDAVKEEPGETSDWLWPNCRFCLSDSPNPTTLLRKVHGTSLGELSGTVWDRGRDRSASKDVLSSIRSVGKYSSHGNQTSRREKGLLRVRPLSWHFLLWRVRVSCHLWTDGNPDGLRSGRFHNNEPLESWKQPAKPESIISVLREAGGQFSSSRQKPFVTPL